MLRRVGLGLNKGMVQEDSGRRPEVDHARNTTVVRGREIKSLSTSSGTFPNVGRVRPTKTVTAGHIHMHSIILFDLGTRRVQLE